MYQKVTPHNVNDQDHPPVRELARSKRIYLCATSLATLCTTAHVSFGGPGSQIPRPSVADEQPFELFRCNGCWVMLGKLHCLFNAALRQLPGSHIPYAINIYYMISIPYQDAY